MGPWVAAGHRKDLETFSPTAHSLGKGERLETESKTDRAYVLKPP